LTDFEGDNLNSKRKGNGGERELCEMLRSYGISAHRNDQTYKSGFDNPDVEINGYHVEVKRTEKLSLYDAVEQAVNDSNGKTPIVCHRKNRKPWVVIMRLEDFIQAYKALKNS
jgi:Holliday junction resolvase